MVLNKFTVTKYRIKITELEGPQFIEMRDWLTENVGDDNWSHKWNNGSGITVDYFYFDQETDAMAFKLVWM